jgi:hypothetical protein
VVVVVAADLVAAEAATAAGAAVIAHVQPRELRLFVLAAASRQRFLLSPGAIVRCFAATASRHKRVVPAAAADVDAAATTAADVAAAVADVTNLPINQPELQQEPILNKNRLLLFLHSFSFALGLCRSARASVPRTTASNSQ